ncbi:mitochondrial 54S ribosomal protein bL31m [Phyllosticta citribraziliensis]|uniref:Ribosomal protein bL31m N-terminal domain-containing protein n=1 Tax=Phyllosticta citribraziliensis TaxID=989973 RepID=A0ABR1M7D2_9PEZI
MSTLFTATRAPRPVAQAFKLSQTQKRNATLIRRPKRPYQFTQAVTLSDGSTFMHRTTSPEPLYKSTKDIKNSLLWNPSSQKLANAEDDLAGRLRSFRNKFGRGWDSESNKKAVEVGPRPIWSMGALERFFYSSSPASSPSSFQLTRSRSGC